MRFLLKKGTTRLLDSPTDAAVLLLTGLAADKLDFGSAMAMGQSMAGCNDTVALGLLLRWVLEPEFPRFPSFSPPSSIAALRCTWRAI